MSLAATTASVCLIFGLAFIALPTMSTNKIASMANKPNRLSLKLIHCESLSPNNSLNAAPHEFPMTYGTTATVLAGSRRNVFYVSFSIGKPPIPQLAVMDTGSSLTWVKCWPCTPCTEGPADIFDPSKSSTFREKSCERYGCTPQSNCNSKNQCTYNITYASGAYAYGIYAWEQLTFETSDGGTAVIPDMKFGCSSSIEGDHRDGQFSGVFGLGYQSLVKQLGSQFSYCIGSITDPYYSYNRLRIGGAAMMEGYSTPMKTVNGQYHVTLQRISIGGKAIGIDRSVFRKTPGSSNDGVIIDSGSTYTWLREEGYFPLRKEVRRIIGRMLPRYEMGWQLCYIGKVERDLQGFPVVTFHFADDADLQLDTKSMFIQFTEGVFCLAVGPSSNLGDYDMNLSIIGIMAQQNYNVGYDLIANRLHFQRIDCELLED